MCIQNVVLFHHLLLKDGRAASSRVPYLSLNERKVGKAQAPRRFEGLWKTDCQVSVIPPFPQPLDATAYRNNSGHISRYGIFRARTSCTAPEPTRDHCAATADRGPSAALRAQTRKRGPCHNADERLPLLPALQLLPPHPRLPPSPFYIGSCLSRRSLTSDTPAMPAPTFAAQLARHRLLSVQIQGDKP